MILINDKKNNSIIQTISFCRYQVTFQKSMFKMRIFTIIICFVLISLTTKGQCPDPTIGVILGSGILEDNLIRNCSSIPNHTLKIYNTSSTFNTNISYKISWGDGAVEFFDNTTFTAIDFISHLYNGFGFYDISIEIESADGCIEVGTYSFYNGANPSVGLAAPGNTTGLCAPATIDFPISNTSNNPEGTLYNIYISGELIATYDQSNLPSSFTYTFLESSCGMVTTTGNYQNAFDVQIEATNPCGSSQATIEPIEVSTPPDISFLTNAPTNYCEGQDFIFTSQNNIWGEVVSGSPSTCSSLPASWSITPGINGVDWEIVSGNTFGSDELIVKFLTLGEYTMTMNISSPSCGDGSYSESFEIIESASSSATANLAAASSPAIAECATTLATFNNESTGEDLSSLWTITPSNGWNYEGNSSSQSEDLSVYFTAPGSYNISLQSSNFCSTDSWDTTLVILDAPGVIISPIDDFCQNGTLNFDASNVQFYDNNNTISSIVWSFPGGVPSSFTGEYPTGIFYNDIGTYTISVTANNECGGNTSYQTFTISETGTIQVMNDQVICANDDPLQVTANPTGGTWSGTGVDDNGLFSPNPNLVGTHILTYNYQENNCLLTDSMQVTVLPIEAVNAGDDQEACINDALFLIPEGTPSNGTWTVDNGGVILGNNAFDPAASGIGVFTLTYSVTDNNGCNNTDTKTIIVHDLPAVEAGLDQSICENPSDLVLTGFTPVGGVWSGQGVSPNGIFNIGNLTGVGTYTLFYTYTNPNTGCSNTDSKTITVEPNEVADAGDDELICIDVATITLTSGMPVGGTWSGTGVISGTNIFDLTVAGAGIHVLVYEYGDGVCQTTDTKVITLSQPPSITLPNLDDMCIYEEDIDLASTTPTGGTWSGNGIIDHYFSPILAGVGTHTLVYNVTDSVSGCTNSDERIIAVHPMSDPNFTIPESACRNDTITFENLSNTGLSYYWDFGDGNSSDEFSPQFAYDVVGTYAVSLTIENSHGCSKSIVDSILITDVPVAFFTPNTLEACVGVELNFTNLSVGEGMTYQWTFGENQTSTEENPGVIYIENGIADTTHVITLEVSNTCGSSVFQEVITVHPQPVANIGLSPLTDCSPVVVDFANTSTGGTNFYWDFGNGITSTETIPSTQTYYTHGDQQDTFTVTLISSNICGSDTASTQVIVDPPNVEAIANASQVSGCYPFEIDFSNNSTPGAVTEWFFGDGNNSSEANPSHTYPHPGEFTAVLYAYSDCGFDTSHINIIVYPEPIVEFEHPTNVCTNQAITFENLSNNVGSTIWDFGDGDSSLLHTPVHKYTAPGEYMVTLTAYSLFSQCPSTYTSVVTILELPEVSFEPSAYVGCAPLNLDFTNTSQNGIFYEWDFGDGTSSSDVSPSHTFEEEGNYAVSLIATDINGCYKDTTIYNINVYPSPTAVFIFNKESQCGLPAEVSFENQSNGATDYFWDFGNGTTSTSSNPSTIYYEVGNFDVTLTTTNQYGCSNIYQKEISILDKPLANFEINGGEGCEPLEVTFENNSVNNEQYFWDFGNGITSTEENPTVVYQNDGTYDVSLIIATDNICFDTFTIHQSVKVHPIPFANFEVIEDASGTPDGTIQLNNLSEDADNYYWEISDGTVYDEENPTHRFFNNANQQIYLEASSEFGCVDDTLINFVPRAIKGLFLPNAFSPEQGLDEVRVFKPAGVGLKEFHIQIFSPYGQLLWESKELENGQPAEAWDGNVNGKLLPQDVYVWKAYGVFEDGSVWQGMPKKNGGYQTVGSVTLLR